MLWQSHEFLEWAWRDFEEENDDAEDTLGSRTFSRQPGSGLQEKRAASATSHRTGAAGNSASRFERDEPARQ
jgi:hypothetical protein